MKTSKSKSTAKSQNGLLVSVARTIGTTLGTLAAKTGSVSDSSITPATGRARAKKKPARAPKTTRQRHKA